MRSSADATTGERSTRRRRIATGLALVALFVVTYVAVTGWQVWDASRIDDPLESLGATGSADAIVVLGAAQYDGDPSPVLRGRLVRALDLYEAGRASYVIPTGSNQAGDRFTEGFAGYAFLRERGVPDEAILIDVNGGNTYQQLTSTRAILSARGLDSVILVSDPYHSFRLLKMAEEVGLDSIVAPTDLDSSAFSLARETAAVSVGRIIGFRRLSNLRD